MTTRINFKDEDTCQLYPQRHNCHTCDVVERPGITDVPDSGAQMQHNGTNRQPVVHIQISGHYL